MTEITKEDFDEYLRLRDIVEQRVGELSGTDEFYVNGEGIKYEYLDNYGERESGYIPTWFLFASDEDIQKYKEEKRLAKIDSERLAKEACQIRDAEMKEKLEREQLALLKAKIEN
jgi:hypothetical protein